MTHIKTLNRVKLSRYNVELIVNSILGRQSSYPEKIILFCLSYHEVIFLDAKELEEVAEGERRECPEGEIGVAMRGCRGGAGLGERHRLHRHEVLHQQVPLIAPAISFYIQR